MSRRYSIVDVFTSSRFSGNPAAVVLDTDGLDADTMQAIAAEFNLSETAFAFPASDANDISRGDSDANTRITADSNIRIRWFTPTMETDMCGHATIAAIHAMVESGRVARRRMADPRVGAANTDLESPAEVPTLRIKTRGGLLTGYVEPYPADPDSYMIWLELVCPTLTPIKISLDELGAALRLDRAVFDTTIPQVCTQDRDLLAFVSDVTTLNGIRPDFERLRRVLDAFELRGISVATTNTLTPTIAVQSRFFAPPAGINEDPVTGSVHGPLAAHLVEQGRAVIQGDTAGLMCVQGIPGGRTGVVWALVHRPQGRTNWVRIGGRTVTVMRGEIVL